MAKSSKGKFGSMSKFRTNFGGRSHKWRGKGGMSKGRLEGFKKSK
jgi:hypothetical protein